MGIFSFLTNQKENGTPVLTNHPIGDLAENQIVIPEDTFIERGKSPEVGDNTVGDSVDRSETNNLDHLYRFLDRNMETNGYDDALRNPDSYHLEQNLDALRKELMRTIKRVKTFYEDFIREIDYHIESRSRSGMIDTVEELKMKKQIAQSHIEKILLIEIDALKKEGDSEGIIISYTRGFRNGLAAISHHTIISKKF